jgi:hypothetical protein
MRKLYVQSRIQTSQRGGGDITIIFRLSRSQNSFKYYKGGPLEGGRHDVLFVFLCREWKKRNYSATQL